jgi:hypothetical protein
MTKRPLKISTMKSRTLVVYTHPLAEQASIGLVKLHSTFRTPVKPVSQPRERCRPPVMQQHLTLKLIEPFRRQLLWLHGVITWLLKSTSSNRTSTELSLTYLLFLLCQLFPTIRHTP